MKTFKQFLLAEGPRDEAYTKWKPLIQQAVQDMADKSMTPTSMMLGKAGIKDNGEIFVTMPWKDEVQDASPLRPQMQKILDKYGFDLTIGQPNVSPMMSGEKRGVRVFRFPLVANTQRMRDICNLLHDLSWYQKKSNLTRAEPQ